MRLLLRDRRVDPAARNNKALVEAAKNGHIDAVSFLLLLSENEYPRIDPAARNNKALVEAVKNKRYEVVGLLLAHPAVDPLDSDALPWASQLRDRRMLQMLFDSVARKHNHHETKQEEEEAAREETAAASEETAVYNNRWKLL